MSSHCPINLWWSGITPSMYNASVLLQQGMVLQECCPFPCILHYWVSYIWIWFSSVSWDWEYYSQVIFSSVQFSSFQSLSRVRLFATPWIAARQASLSITISRSSLRHTSIESLMPSSHLILCRPLLLLPPISPSIRVFSNESTLRMRWQSTGVSLA